MPETVLAPGFKAEPYWWEAAPRSTAPPADIPRIADVVVGSGYTGLSAALTLARAGRRTVVLEAGVPGFGASTRNAGYVGQALLLPFSDLIRKIGLKRAIACYREANAAFLIRLSVGHLAAMLPAYYMPTG